MGYFRRYPYGQNGDNAVLPPTVYQTTALMCFVTGFRTKGRRYSKWGGGTQPRGVAAPVPPTLPEAAREEAIHRRDHLHREVWGCHHRD